MRIIKEMQCLTETKTRKRNKKLQQGGGAVVIKRGAENK